MSLALGLAVGLLYGLVGLAHAVVMGETDHTTRVVYLLVWPLLYVIMVALLWNAAYQAMIDKLQGVSADD